MKKKLLSLCILGVFQLSYAQTARLNVVPEDAEIFVNSAPGKKIKTDPQNGAIAYKTGYATQGKTGTEIANEGGSEYTFDLVPVPTKLSSSVPTKKIEVTKLVNGIGPNAFLVVGFGYYSLLDISQPKFLKGVSTQLSDLGYRVVGTNAVFSGKSDVPDLALAGEVIWHTKDTRGSGFQVSIIVHWSLYDVKNENIVLEVNTGGYSDTKNKFDDELVLALKDAARSLTSNSKFIELTQKATSRDDVSSLKDNAVVLSPIGKKNYTGYGDMIKNVVNSCLTIETNFGHGSGFLISNDGYILTNNHVISGAEKVDVRFDNGFSFSATVVKKNIDRDVALLKISGNGFKALPLNTNTDNASVGTDVVAIGTPEDIKLGQSVTKGIISGKREVDEKSFIQTDVAINSGNSGGPLINSSGEVVGIIVSKIMGKTKAIEGIGFAIPIKEALDKLNIKFD